MNYNSLLLVPIVLLSYSAQVLSGFGSIVIAVTLGAHLFPIEHLLPILVPLDFLTCGYVALRHFRHTDFAVLFKRIIPFMFVGLGLGIILSHLLAGRVLKIIFGVFIVFISVRELMQIIRPHARPGTIEKIKFIAYVFSAGVIYGIYASGGPLLVYAVSKLKLSKGIFRSTLTTLWVLLDVILIVSYWINGGLNIAAFKYVGFLLPVVGLGVLIGEKLHYRVNEYWFRIIIFSILLLAGGTLIVS